MKHQRFILLTLLTTALLVALGVGLIHAQESAPQGQMSVQTPVGTAFTYQGRLTDGGRPANGTYDFRFILYDAAVGGSQVGEIITLDNVPVHQGAFTVQLDFGRNAFDGNARWLEIAVRPGNSSGGYNILTPRQPITPVPYALYSLAAPWSGLTGIPAGFADGVDNDTTYTAGTGLTLSGTRFSLDTSYTDARYWKLGGNSGTHPTADILGTTDNVTLTLAVSGTAALRLAPTTGTPNVIGGYSGNSVTEGVVGATIGGGGASGRVNQVTANYGTVGGGTGNEVSGPGAFVGGGGWNGTSANGNKAQAPASTISGGYGNSIPAVGHYGTIGGGMSNTAVGYAAAVGGGSHNTATGDYAFVGGGIHNSAGRASIQGSTVAGGSYNTASGSYATVGGGLHNTASNNNATVGGGSYNRAIAAYATIAGGGPSDPNRPTNTNNVVYDAYGTIGGGGHNYAGSNDSNPSNATFATVGGGRDNRALGPYTTVGGGWNNTARGDSATAGGGKDNSANGDNATIGGGRENIANGKDTTIGGGYGNATSGDSATVGGGVNNTASGNNATVGGGQTNIASGIFATVGGGNHNTASGANATVGGGWNNTASGGNATVGGGRINTASGFAATVPGGVENEASGDYSFAAGRRAQANRTGCFVWSDAGGGSVSCNVVNRTVFRSSGGFYIYTNANMTTGARLSTGSGSWSSLSDRNAKANITPVDPEEVLERLVTLSISTWNYKAQDPSIRHMGPMAQDFYAAFGLGEDDRYIDSIDADGVALAAIQALYARNQQQAARIAQLEAENAAQRAQIQALQQQLADLAARLAALERKK